MSLQLQRPSSPCDRNAAMNGYVLFGKDRPGRQHGGVAFYVRE